MHRNLQFSEVVAWLIPVIGAIISVVHFQGFYYSYDTPKWFVFDVALSLYIFFSLKRHECWSFSYLGILFIFLLVLMLISLYRAPHTVAGVEFIVRFVLAGFGGYCLLKDYSKQRLVEITLNTVFFVSIGIFVGFYF